MIDRLRRAVGPRPSDVPNLAMASAAFAFVGGFAFLDLPRGTIVLSLLLLPAWAWAAFRAARYVRYRRHRLLIVVVILVAIPLANAALPETPVRRGDWLWLILGLPNAALFGLAALRAARHHRRSGP